MKYKIQSTVIQYNITRFDLKYKIINSHTTITPLGKVCIYFEILERK